MGYPNKHPDGEPVSQAGAARGETSGKEENPPGSQGDEVPPSTFSKRKKSWTKKHKEDRQYYMRKLEEDPQYYMRMLRGNVDRLNVVWKNHFSYSERFVLFWRSPLILFTFKTIWRLFLTFFFTFSLYHVPNTDPSVWRYHLSDQIGTWEWMLAGYFVGYLFNETIEFVLQPDGYFTRDFFWNLFDNLACFGFIFPFVFRVDWQSGDWTQANTMG